MKSATSHVLVRCNWTRISQRPNQIARQILTLHPTMPSPAVHPISSPLIPPTSALLHALSAPDPSASPPSPPSPTMLPSTLPPPTCHSPNSFSTTATASTITTKRIPPSPPSITPKRPRFTSPSIQPCITPTISASSSISTTRRPPLATTPTAELPDEVLVHIFRFIHTAPRLANLRLVCRQWRRVIDTTPLVWRHVSFKNTSFTRSVQSHNNALRLGPRPGRRAVTLAARSGNEWARFLKAVLFEHTPLHAVTIPQPLASDLVCGITTSSCALRPNGWMAVHAARGGDAGKGLPRGALVGIVHVGEGKVDRAVVLKKPIRCAGFVGVWRVSAVLTDLLVGALHRQ